MTSVPRSDDRRPTPPRHRWPFVGRVDEQRVGRQALREPGGGGVVIVGPPGSGKSALAHRLVAARPKPSLVCTVQAESELRGESFGALIPTVIDHLGASELFLGASDRTGEGRSIAAMLRALRTRVAPQSALDAPPVIRVENADQLDPDSATVLAQLVAAGPAKLVVTCRRPQQVAPSLARLWRDGPMSRIDLAPLTEEELDDAAAQFLGAPLTFAASDALHRATSGNALFIRELVTHAHRSGALELRDAAWTWTGDLDPGVRLTEVIASTLHRRSDAQREALALVALAEPIQVGVLARTADPTAIDELETEGIVVATDDAVPTMSLANPLHRDLVRELVPRARRIELHRSLIEPLDRDARAAVHGSVRATLWALGCGFRFGHEHLVRLARRANLHHDYAAAERIAGAALVDDPSGAARVELAYALRFLGRPDEAAALLDTAPNGHFDPRTHVAATQLRMHIAQFSADDVDAAIRIGDQALAAAHGPPERAAIQVARVVSLGYSGRFDEALDDLGTLVSDPDLPPALAAAAVVPFAIACSLRGEYESAGRSLDLVRSRVSANEDGNRWIIEEMTSARVFTCIQQGDLAGAQAGMQSMLAVADPSVHFDRGLHQVARARIALLQGRATVALSDARGAIAAFEVSDPSGFLAWALGIAAEAAALCDEAELSAAFAQRARSTPLRLSRLVQTDLRRSLLWAVAVTSGLAQAIAEGLELADELQALGLRGLELQVLHDVFRLGDREVADRARVLAASIEGPRAAAVERLMAAEVEDDIGGLVAASQAFEDFGAWLYAAEAAAVAAGRFADAGRATSAREATKRVTRLRRSTGRVTVPLLADSAPVELTAREREVAWLAARGLTNPQIAAQINVAPRTVEGHLHRLYAKLGVSDRGELKDVLAL